MPLRAARIRVRCTGPGTRLPERAVARLPAIGSRCPRSVRVAVRRRRRPTGTAPASRRARCRAAPDVRSAPPMPLARGRNRVARTGRRAGRRRAARPRRTRSRPQPRIRQPRRRGRGARRPGPRHAAARPRTPRGTPIRTRVDAHRAPATRHGARRRAVRRRATRRRGPRSPVPRSRNRPRTAAGTWRERAGRPTPRRVARLRGARRSRARAVASSDPRSPGFDTRVRRTTRHRSGTPDQPPRQARRRPGPVLRRRRRPSCPWLPAQAETVIWFRTPVTPGADQAACSACRRSAQEDTVPERVTSVPWTPTVMRLASS